MRPAGRAHSTVLINESLLLARQGEELVERQLRCGEVYVGRKPVAKHWPDEQELHTRRSGWMRRHPLESENSFENQISNGYLSSTFDLLAWNLKTPKDCFGRLVVGRASRRERVFLAQTAQAS